MATMVLCESYGLTGEPGLHKAAQSAINYLAAHHTRKGGWGYNKALSYCDTSITAWAIQAYQAAQDFGIDVETENLKDAQSWIHTRTNTRGRCGYDKARSNPNQRKDGSYAGSFDPSCVWGKDGGRIYSTAMALLCLQAPYRYERVVEVKDK